jgi:hypothetical protein
LDDIGRHNSPSSKKKGRKESYLRVRLIKDNLVNEDMPGRELKSRIERLIGTRVESYRLVEGGYTPALRLVCKTNEASFFVKIGTTPLTSKNLNREIHIYNCLSGNFMPRACD